MRYIISLLLTSLALPAWAQVPQVVTDIPPVQALTAQVMGTLGTPVLLLAKGADEHDFALRPSLIPFWSWPSWRGSPPALQPSTPNMPQPMPQIVPTPKRVLPPWTPRLQPRLRL